ncbi:hypothetical protein [Flaviflexus huanghaiensis]|uniref:hypothetical protein n=1 Tax=Flaviflexus huanghaiensis TaxID=1111473 RepID=UPI0015FE7B35|nr:hypothetical protein [Flaviflexus huanghaiensis]
MTTTIIHGEIDDLFSHMVLLGLASVVEDSGHSPVRLVWTDEEQSALVAREGFGSNEIAQVVHAHAASHAARDSWLRHRFSFSKGAKSFTVSTTAPRTAGPEDPADWRRLDAVRQRSLESMPSALDHRFVQGLGYRSWWYRRGKDLRADVGANIWEMRTRNKGTEFIRDRLLPLAEIVAGWPVEKVESGLLGTTLDDPHGNNKLDSRSPTGFSTPRPVDNARAWCALWGLSMLPVAHLNNPSHAYPAYSARGRVGTGSLHQLLMPVPNRQVTPARMRALLRSRQLIDAVDEQGEGAYLKKKGAWEWLKQQGAAAVIRFPVQYVGSTSAPERQALSGVRVWP